MGTHTFTTAGPTHLHVEVGRGSVRLATHDAATTEIDVEGAELHEVQVRQDQDGIRVVGPRARTGFGGPDHRVRVTATVPDGSSAVVHCGSADVHVSGSLASLAVRSGSGGVRLEDATGPLLVETGSGDVALGHVRDDVRVKSGSGDVVLARLAAPVAVRTGSGDLTVHELLGDLQWSTGSGDLSVLHARRGSIRVATAVGDVSVGVAAGTPVWTDVTSFTGSVTSHLPPVGAPADGQEHVEVRGTSATGDITLHPAPSQEA